MNAIVWGMGDEVVSDIDDLRSFGFQLIGEKAPADWSGKAVEPERDWTGKPIGE